VGFKIGTSSYAGFVNIRITDCLFDDCPTGAVKLERGGRLVDARRAGTSVALLGTPDAAPIALAPVGRHKMLYSAAETAEGSAFLVRHIDPTGDRCHSYRDSINSTGPVPHPCPGRSRAIPDTSEKHYPSGYR
jgi:hypothetical protein